MIGGHLKIGLRVLTTDGSLDCRPWGTAHPLQRNCHSIAPGIDFEQELGSEFGE